MTVTAVHKDPVALTLTVTAEFNATPERVWQLWADPRQLERWWGPPSYPATFTTHDLTPGARIDYYMTGPNGEQPHGWWKVVETQPPRHLVISDGLADETGQPDPDFPIAMMRVAIDDIGSGRTRMSIRNEFPSVKAMEQMIAMGMEQGMTEAVGQIDAILAEPVAAVS
jgi:uncharacterized protein YndB with AHSA1/START domain